MLSRACLAALSAATTIPLPARCELRNPEPLLYYKWYWRDHRASRNVQRLSSLERGLHRELLDAQWEHGFIPDDVEKLAGICDCPVEVMRDAWPNIRRCYEPCESDPAKLINLRMERERERSDAKRAKLAKAGLRGIIARIRRENAKYPSANAEPPKTPFAEVVSEAPPWVTNG